MKEYILIFSSKCKHIYIYIPAFYPCVYYSQKHSSTLQYKLICHFLRFRFLELLEHLPCGCFGFRSFWQILGAFLCFMAFYFNLARSMWGRYHSTSRCSVLATLYEICASLSGFQFAGAPVYGKQVWSDMKIRTHHIIIFHQFCLFGRQSALRCRFT